VRYFAPIRLDSRSRLCSFNKKEIQRNMKRKIYLFLALLTGFTIFGSGNVNAQTYSCQGHQYGCEYATNSRRYAAINSLEILTGGTSIYKKTPDGCNMPGASGNGNGHYNVMSTQPSFTLVAGNTYEVKYSISNPAGYNGYQNYFLAYLDLDGDGNYTSTGEHVSNGWSTSSGTGIVTRSFTIPCTGAKDGVSRIRFRTDYQYGNLRNNQGSHSSRGYYGETEEFTITMSSPSSIISTFSMVDTVFIGTAAKATYTGNGGFIWWDWENDDNVDQVGGAVFTGISTSVLGSFDLECRSANCFGTDSVVRSIVVVNPSAAVVADFVADETTVQLYEDIQFYDLSDNGPTDWNWEIYDTNQTPHIVYDLTWKSGGTDQNPVFDFFDPGLFTVCLTGYNIFGWGNTTCKVDYVEVTPFKEWDVSASWGTPIQSTEGRLYDKGGVVLPYENNASKFTNFLAVIPCNADKIDLTFKQFRMADDNDVVFIFDGPDVNGTPLHPAGGFKSSAWNSRVPFTVTANSGAFFIYYESNNSGTDSGFIADWVSTQGSGQKPVAKIDAAAVMYNGVENSFKSISENVGGLAEYVWTIDGNQEGFQKDLDYTFYTDGTYDVCLNVKTCLGDSTICKTIKVETPKDPTNTDFTADDFRPKLDSTVNFMVTNDIANNFEWSVNPPNFVYKNGTGATDKEPSMAFTKAGCYTISLTAWNDRNTNATSRTIVKGSYICVVDYCKPTATPTTTDISINNVILKNATTTLLNNSSAVESSGYSDFTSTHVAEVVMGGKYDLDVRRNTNSDPWNGKAWIDWNIDGDFDDPGEEILSEGTSAGNIFSTSVTVPNYLSAFEGNSRMRIAVGYKGNVPTRCGPTYIGEYEDYTIKIVKDKDIPVIKLAGMDTVLMEKGTSYIEPGYTALDPSQGDITTEVTTTSDLEVNETGYYTITYNVCDNSGNCADPQVRFIKVVIDISAPVLTLANPVINVNVNDKRACLGSVNSTTFDYSAIGATASDALDGNLTSFIQYDNTIVNMDVAGTYNVIFWVQDIQGNKDTKTATVNVRDIFAPSIYQNGPNNIPLGSTWVEQTSICDKYDDAPVLDAVPGQSGFPNGNVRGTYVVTYTAMDASGNTSAPIVRTYRVDDFEAPTIYLNTADTIYHDVNEKYYSATPSVRDNYFDADEISLIKTGIVTEEQIGMYMETYTAADPLNNKSVKTRYVRVLDREAPQITGDNLNVPLFKDFWWQSGLIISDNYYKSEDLMPLVKVISSNVNTDVAGSYSMTFQLTDPSGNKSQFFTRNVNVGANYEQTIGLNELDINKNINVYPVPTSNGIVKVSIDEIKAGDVKAQLVNTLGAVIMDIGIVENNQEIDLTNISHGIYFIRFEVANNYALKKIILD